ncbi:hypothetical protein N9A45_00145 [bacterium]|nr:hypothetical protein [bacterium]
MARLVPSRLVPPDEFAEPHCVNGFPKKECFTQHAGRVGPRTLLLNQPEQDFDVEVCRCPEFRQRRRRRRQRCSGRHVGG